WPIVLHSRYIAHVPATLVEASLLQRGLLNEEFLKAYLSMTFNHEKYYLVFCQDCPLVKVKIQNVSAKCDGHLIKKFIKECWVKYDCDTSCKK
ncbi:Histone-lysine N-methyltransferase SUVR4, partial [Linum grandiflorum]